MSCAYVGRLGAGVLRDTLYITNANGDTVTKCDIDPASGNLSNCGLTGALFNRPYSIAFYMGLYAYIANEFSSDVTQCTISLDGSLVDCFKSGSPSGTQVNYLVVTANYILVAAFNAGQVLRCQITPATGLLTNCIAVGSGFNGPMGITVG